MAEPYPKNFRLPVFSAIYCLLLIAYLVWFVSSGPPLEAEASFRIVLGSLFIFILPGLVWGEILGFRSTHILQTIALSFALTLCLEILILPIPFLFSCGIGLWIALLFVLCFTGIVILWLRCKKGFQRLKFLNPLLNLFALKQLRQLPLLLVIAVLAYAAYRWGEKITDISGEKLLHLFFVRHYFAAPLILKDIAVIPGANPPNLVHLWEFLIAGWSALIHVDPLFVFFRARFVIPVLGLSAMYLLAQAIFRRRRKVAIVTWGVLVMVVGEFMYLTPSHLTWIKESDGLRGVMAFLGTVHHADSALDILIALCAAMIVLTLRRPNRKNVFLFAGVLLATFLWHTREFFQAGIYMAVLGLTLLVAPLKHNVMAMKKYVKITGVFLVVVSLLVGAYWFLVSKQTYMRNESESKRRAIALAVLPENILTVRILGQFPCFFEVPTHVPFSQAKNAVGSNLTDWGLYLWFMISLAAIPLLAYWGDETDKRLIWFYFLMLFFCYCWNFSALMLVALTYREIFACSPRIVYLFAYLVIGELFCVLYRRVSLIAKKNRAFLWYPGLLFVVGVIIQLLFMTATHVQLVLLFAFLTLCVLIALLLTQMVKPKTVLPPGHPSFAVAIVGILLFFAPLYALRFKEIGSRPFSTKRAALDWFGAANPFGFSTALIREIQALPIKQMFMVNPAGQACFFLYAPHYAGVMPSIVWLDQHMAEQKAAREGHDPLFGVGPVEDVAIKRRLDLKKVQVILVNEKKHYARLLPYFRSFPSNYKIMADRPDRGELLVKYQKT